METVVPFSQEAEASILGGLFLNPSGLPAVKSQLAPEDFYLTANMELYKAMLAVGSDVVMLADHLRLKGTLDLVGGVDGIGSIISGVATSAGMDRYVKIVKEASQKRHIINVCSDVIESIGQQSIDDTLSDLKVLIRSNVGDDSTEKDAGTLLSEVYTEIERRNADKDFECGIPTGISAIDEKLSGLEAKTLTYLIARPSVGKTALAIAMAENMAKLNRGKVLFFSLEMGDRQIMRRLLASESNVFLSRIRHGDIEDGQWDQLVKSADQLKAADLLILDSSKYKTIETLISKAEAVAIDSQISCVYVDHIQLMRSKQKFSSRHLEISFISDSLKSLAKDLDIPVVGLCQLNRGVEKRAVKRPELSDMKESGDLEQDADNVIGIYRETKESETMELGGLKGRDTGTWQCEVTFDRYTQRIR
jgi:replicative DNA helicase